VTDLLPVLLRAAEHMHHIPTRCDLLAVVREIEADEVRFGAWCDREALRELGQLEMQL